jgi:hypothetical protein
MCEAKGYKAIRLFDTFDGFPMRTPLTSGFAGMVFGSGGSRPPQFAKYACAHQPVRDTQFSFVHIDARRAADWRFPNPLLPGAALTLRSSNTTTHLADSLNV